ncbi:MAG: hypothetical protein AAF251_08270 [Pseudomonadota bacterium]
MQLAFEMDEIDPVDKDEVWEEITLMRPSGTKVHFDGRLLADGQSQTNRLPFWHRIEVYQKAGPTYVVSISKHPKGTEEMVSRHIFNAHTIWDAMEVIENFGDTLGDGLNDEARSTEATSVALGVKRHYNALVGDLLFHLRTAA